MMSKIRFQHPIVRPQVGPPLAALGYEIVFFSCFKAKDNSALGINLNYLPSNIDQSQNYRRGTEFYYFTSPKG